MVAGGRFLVTGGAGFIGSHIVDALLARGAAFVAATDNFSLGKRANLAPALSAHPALRLLEADCTSAAAMREVSAEIGKVDWCIHCAVEPLEHSLVDPQGSFHRNVVMCEVVCELQRSGAFERLLAFSSSEVYGTALTSDMPETHPYEPHTPYAAAKCAGDLLVQSYVRTFRTPAVVLRPFNNYGPRQNASEFAGIVPRTLKRLADGQAPILSGTGAQTRDFCYVEDTARAVLAVLDACAAEPARLDGRVYNVASGVETSMQTLVAQLAELWGWRGEIERQPARPGDVMRHKGSMEKFERELGPLPRTPFAVGLARTVAWYRDEFGR
jgi:UDP-glucose 4-epimerase